MRRLNSFLFALFIAYIFTGAAEAQLGRQQGLLDPNLASAEELLALPHADSTLVKGMLERRPFASMADLNAFLGATLSKEQLVELYKKMFLHLDLNAASEQEIMLIPGVGKRMAHEFEEYRPYKSFAQFRREIGKYVDEKEVARLEQYVFLPINLNTAGEADILSIPGGERLLKAAKAQRPYENSEHFRREMGKQWDPKEIARFERYLIWQ